MTSAQVVFENLPPQLPIIPKSRVYLTFIEDWGEPSSETKQNIIWVFPGCLWYKDTALWLPELDPSAWNHSVLLPGLKLLQMVW